VEEESENLTAFSKTQERWRGAMGETAIKGKDGWSG